jgi:hypothetical protein
MEELWVTALVAWALSPTTQSIMAIKMLPTMKSAILIRQTKTLYIRQIVERVCPKTSYTFGAACVVLVKDIDEFVCSLVLLEDQKKPRCRGWTRNGRHRIAYSDRGSPAAARAFTASLLFTFGDETGLLDGLPLLLAGLLPAAAFLLATFAALLILLITLIRHLCSLGQVNDNASWQPHVPMASRQVPASPPPLSVEEVDAW